MIESENLQQALDYDWPLERLEACINHVENEGWQVGVVEPLVIQLLKYPDDGSIIGTLFYRDDPSDFEAINTCSVSLLEDIESWGLSLCITGDNLDAIGLSGERWLKKTLGPVIKSHKSELIDLLHQRDTMEVSV